MTTPSRTCRDASTAMPAWLLQPDSVPAAFRAHLSSCARCCREWQELEDLHARLTAPSVSTDQLVEARLRLRRGQQQQQQQQRPSPAPSRSLRRQGLLRAAAFLLGLGLLGPAATYLSRGGGPRLDRLAPRTAASADDTWSLLGRAGRCLPSLARAGWLPSSMERTR